MENPSLLDFPVAEVLLIPIRIRLDSVLLQLLDSESGSVLGAEMTNLVPMVGKTNLAVDAEPSVVGSIPNCPDGHDMDSGMGCILDPDGRFDLID